MPRHRALSAFLALAAAAGASLLTASSAAADDAGLFGAYNARQPTDIAAASAEYERAIKIVRRSDGRRGARAVLRANRGLNDVLTVVEGELSAQAASSDHGITARRCALREVRGWRRANRYESRGWRRAMRGESPERWAERAGDEMLRAYKQGRRAVRQFKAVGLSSPLRAITQTP